MQKLQETKEKLFQEIKDLIQRISEFSNEEDFLKNIHLFNELQEKTITFKNFRDINTILLGEDNNLQSIERQAINFEIDTKKINDLEENLEEDIVVEENPVSEKIDEEYFIGEEKNHEDSENIVLNNEAENNSETSLVKENQDLETREEENSTENLHPSFHSEKKFKLAHIKGLNISVPSLFDEPALETPEKEKEFENSEKTENKIFNVLKLDLNDKIAFSKFLFNGSQAELNEVAKKINEMDNLEEAKTFLSDLYYQKNWENVDEYAQRLWNLVENKFL